MPEHQSVPDLLFDADRANDGALRALRDSWVIANGVPVLDPIIGYGWRCPECGEGGDLGSDWLEILFVRHPRHPTSDGGPILLDLEVRRASNPTPGRQLDDAA
jgi:hypothetical protein